MTFTGEQVSIKVAATPFSERTHLLRNAVHVWSDEEFDNSL